MTEVAKFNFAYAFLQFCQRQWLFCLIAQCYCAIWRQNSRNGYFAASAKIALSLMLTQTLTQTLTLIPTLALTLTQTEEKYYFASRGKIATSFAKIT